MSRNSLNTYLLLTCSAMILAACATPAPDADYGNYPTNYENQIQTTIAGMMLDPESARVRIGRPIQGYMTNALAYGGGVSFTGYIVPVEVNGKNRFGGYVGYQPYFCIVHNSNVQNCFAESYEGSMFAHVVR